jgi:hypothetical protein
MRNLMLLEAYRDREAELDIYGAHGDSTCGCFAIPSPIDGQKLGVIASAGGGWDHVSVSRSNRCPNWPEMEFVKRHFFKEDETAMQLHVPPSEHINMHPYALHLWRPQNVEIPRPPGWMVGPKEKEDA